MVRRRSNRHVGCSVESTPSGLLRFRFRSAMPDGRRRRFTEATLLPDTPENRVLAGRQAAVIAAELRAGTFNYLRWFASGNCAAAFLVGTPAGKATSDLPTEAPPTVETYYRSWIKRNVPPMVRPTQARDYTRHLEGYVIAKLGDTPLCELSLDHLEDLRTYLRVERGLSTKFSRNIIDGSFRAMVRDARKSGIVARFPFLDLEWPRGIVPGPDPFTPDERDRLLDYFLRKDWRVGRGDGSYSAAKHYPYYAFLFTLFFTGMRPSEAVAIRNSALDLHAATLRVERSRSLGHEAAPKTPSANRVVRLTPRNVQILRSVVELHAAPEDYLFKNTLGLPIEQRSFYRLFRDAVRVLEIRPRDLYATKDTFVSTAITAGVNLTWLSDQTGVAEQTLRKHYGRFVHSSAADALELDKIDPTAAPLTRKRRQIGHRLDTPEVRRSATSGIFRRLEVEQKGFEPSTPTLRTWCSPN